MNQFRTFALVFLAAALLFAFVESTVQPNSSTSGVTVGVSCPLTGDLAEYGAAVRNGIELARLESPGAYTGIRFAYEDNQYDPARAVSALHKLRTVEAVNVIYNWGEPTLQSIAPIVRQAKLPVIAMSLDPEPALDNPYVIRSINYAEQYAKTLLQYLRSKGYKKLAVIKTEDPFLNSMIDGLTKNLHHDERLTVAFSVQPEQSDFRTEILKLKNMDVDAVGIYLFSGQVSSLYRQAADIDFKKPSFGTDFFESKTEIQDAHGAMSGAVYPNIAVPESFVASYRERFGNDIQIAYAYNAYSFARLTSHVFPNGEVLSTEEILARYTHPHSTGTLDYVYRETPEGGKFYEFPLVVRQILGDSIVNLATERG